EIRVEDARSALQVFQMSAAFGGWRVCIVDCAEDLNRSSANVLLKMIEEPPQRSLILIVSHRPGRVLPTIRSRCRRIKLDPLSEDEIVASIAALGPPWSEADPAAVPKAARRASGSVREALARLSPDAEAVDALIDSTIHRLPRPDPRAVLKLADALADREAAEAYDAFHRELYDWLAGCMFWRLSPRSPRPIGTGGRACSRSRRLVAAVGDRGLRKRAFPLLSPVTEQKTGESGRLSARVVDKKPVVSIASPHIIMTLL